MKSFWGWHNEKKELKRAAADRIRDEKLNSIILNPRSSQIVKKTASIPYEVDYGKPGQTYTDKNPDLNTQNKHNTMVQLVENTEFSSRKFIFNLSGIIRIGSGLIDNDIVVANGGIEEHQCEIFLAQKKVYVRNMGHYARTIVKRKKRKIIVDNRGIRIVTGDKIILADIVYEVTVIET